MQREMFENSDLMRQTALIFRQKKTAKFNSQRTKTKKASTTGPELLFMYLSSSSVVLLNLAAVTDT